MCLPSGRCLPEVALMTWPPHQAPHQRPLIRLRHDDGDVTGIKINLRHAIARKRHEGAVNIKQVTGTKIMHGAHRAQCRPVRVCALSPMRSAW